MDIAFTLWSLETLRVESRTQNYQSGRVKTKLLLKKALLRSVRMSIESGQFSVCAQWVYEDTPWLGGEQILKSLRLCEVKARAFSVIRSLGTKTTTLQGGPI